MHGVVVRVCIANVSVYIVARIVHRIETKGVKVSSQRNSISPIQLPNRNLGVRGTCPSQQVE
jgi:hypothetical protein